MAFFEVDYNEDCKQVLDRLESAIQTNYQKEKGRELALKKYLTQVELAIEQQYGNSVFNKSKCLIQTIKK